VGQQVDEEPRPHLVADSHGGHGSTQPGDDLDRIGRLRPRLDREHPWLLDDAGSLEPGDHQRRLAVTRHDEHRQALEHHRVVAGEVRQVVADGEQQHVDRLLGHPLADAIEAVEIGGREVHRAIVAGTGALTRTSDAAALA
jgi:hypothetical protein